MNYKHPRTMQEAFGPYTDDYVYDDDPSETWVFWLALGVTVFLALLAVLIVRLLIC